MNGSRSLLAFLALVIGLAYLIFSDGKKPGNRQHVPSVTGPEIPGNQDLVIGSPVISANLAIFPIVSKSPRNNDRFITLDEGLRAGTVEVLERGAAQPNAANAGPVAEPQDPFARPSRPMVDANAAPAIAADPFAAPSNQEAAPGAVGGFDPSNSVNNLVVINHSSKPLYLMPGEIVVGGSQDRTIGEELVIAADGKPLEIGVYCVEHGRWGGRDEQTYASLLAQASAVTAQAGNFGGQAADSDSFQGNLSLVVSQTTETANRGKFVDSIGSLNKASRIAVQRGDGQPKVWDEVAKENARSGVAAESGTFAGNYAEAKPTERLSPYMEQLQTPVADVPNIVGVVVAVNGKVDSIDIFESTPLFRKLWPKLLKSYALDAANAADGSPPQRLAVQDDARKFLDEIGSLQAQTADSDDKLAISKAESERAFFFSAHERKLSGDTGGPASAPSFSGIHGFGGMH